jgi:GNAT superfamily N-acetyltransferase
MANMESDLRFRRAAAGDADVLQLLGERANARRLGTAIPDFPDPQAVEELRDRLARVGAVAVLAEDVEGPVASCFATPLVGPGGEPVDGGAHLSGVAVAPGRWGQGLGDAIVAFAEQVLYDEGFGFVQLHVLETNYRARTLYERRGWSLSREGDPHPEGSQAVYEKQLAQRPSR